MENLALLTDEYKLVGNILIELGIPAHRIGFWQLSTAISLYAEDPTQCMTKELYPSVAGYFRCGSWKNVERTIRHAIGAAWDSRDPAVWNKYFPNSSRTPSNKYFIAMLARQLQ